MMYITSKNFEANRTPPTKLEPRQMFSPKTSIETDRYENMLLTYTLKENHYWIRIEADFHGFLLFFPKIIRDIPCPN